MISYEAYELTAIHNMGAVIRTYRTNRRRQTAIICWSLITAFIFVSIIVLSANHFQFSTLDLTTDAIFLGIFLFLTIVFFLPIWLIPNTTIYICTDGLIVTPHKHQSLAVHWQKIEWASATEGQCIIHLLTGEDITLGRYIEKAEDLAREIELKSQLASRDQQDNIELQFERITNNQQSRKQQKQHIIAQKKDLIYHETDDEATNLQKEYSMGTILATYHAGFKGILRKKIIPFNIFRLALPFAIFYILYKISIFSFMPAYNFIHSYIDIFWIIWIFFCILYPTYHLARYTRLHLYQDGLIYIETGLEGLIFEVVHWSDIEKITYHKTNPLISPPFCQLYLTNGDKIVISGYIHSQPTLKNIFEARFPTPQTSS